MANVELVEYKLNYNNNELTYKFINQDPNLSRLIISFNNELYKETKELQPGEVSLTFKNQTDIPILIGMFTRSITTQKRIVPNMYITFNITNNNRTLEEQLAKQIISVVPVNNEAIYKEPPQEVINKQNEQIIEEQQELTATGTKQIIKEDIDGKDQKYIEIDDKIYNDNAMLSINEQKQALLQQWLADPVIMESIKKMTREQLDIELTKAVTSNLKQYDLTSPTNTNFDNEQAAITNQVAERNGGKGNPELGIIENSPNTSSQFTVVEETRTNGYNVGAPTTTEQTISSTGQTQSTQSSGAYFENNYMTTSSEEYQQEREVEEIYYYDDSYTIYNAQGEIIGVANQNNSLYIDMNNNLVKDGQVIGTVENIRDMPQAKTNTNVRKKVLEKPNGFISFMFIALGISMILLIYILITLI